MAANITEQYFVTLFREFERIDRAVLAAYLDIATIRVPKTVWGGVYMYATALLTAHMLTAQGHASTGGGQGGAGGAVTAEAVGDLSRSYQVMAEAGSGDTWLATTRYGLDFIELRNENIIGMMPTGPARFPRGCP